MTQHEKVELEYGDDEKFIETPEFLAWVDDRLRKVDENPGRSYTYEELMRMGADVLARLDQ